jgi:GT2 family glycosyltransferase
MKDLSIITVTHQSALFIEDQVFSILSGGVKLSLEQIIVDNASTDGTQEVLDRISPFLTKIIKNRQNVGFSKANNQALSYATGRYLLFLNPDMKVEKESLDKLVKWMDEHPETGISSCMLIDAIGRQQVAGLPRPLPSLFFQVLWILRMNFLCSQPKKQEWRQLREAETVKGAFMLVRRELVEKLGFAFDPRYFLLYEDTDLCREAKRLGYKIAFHPEIHCVDFNSRSFVVKSEPWIYRCFTESMLLYFRKWESWYRWIWLALLIPIGSLLRFPPWKRRN